MIHIEHRTLCAFEEHIGARLAELLQDTGHIRDQGLDPIGEFQIRFQHLLKSTAAVWKYFARRNCGEIQNFAELGCEAFALEQIDTARARRATLSSYAGPIPQPVVPMAFAPLRLLARRSSATCEARIKGHAGLTRKRSKTGTPCADQHFRFLEQRLERNTTPLPIRHCTRACRMPDGINDRYGLLAADDQRVTGVVAALKAHHGLHAGRSARSTTLPLPSSPHCRPMTTRFFTHYEPSTAVPIRPPC